MTPRVVVAVADQEMTLEDFLKDSRFASFSRIPIYADNDENITGYIRVGDAHSGDHNAQLKDISRKIIVVPKGTKALSMFEKFVEQKEHIAQIVDEYGGLCLLEAAGIPVPKVYGLTKVLLKDENFSFPEVCSDWGPFVKSYEEYFEKVNAVIEKTNK